MNTPDQASIHNPEQAKKQITLTDSTRQIAEEKVELKKVKTKLDELSKSSVG